jgi:hypothetical protein
MCFGGGGGPSKEEKQVSVDQRLEADQAKREEVEKVAEQKKEDIQSAIEERSIGTKTGGAAVARRSGTGQRSLFRSRTGGGFLGRFG